MILKPFMLRRIKKDVENELSDKVSDILKSFFKKLIIDKLGLHFKKNFMTNRRP